MFLIDMLDRNLESERQKHGKKIAKIIFLQVEVVKADEHLNRSLKFWTNYDFISIKKSFAIFVSILLPFGL
jgi:hypothetical protein